MTAYEDNDLENDNSNASEVTEHIFEFLSNTVFYDDKVEYVFMGYMFILATVLVVGILGNVLILYVMLVRWQVRSNFTFYTASLAICQILKIVIIVPVIICLHGTMLLRNPSTTRLLCKTFRASAVFFTVHTSLVMLFSARDRLRQEAIPWRITHLRQVVLRLVVTFMVSSSFAIPAFIFYDHAYHDLKSHSHQWDQTDASGVYQRDISHELHTHQCGLQPSYSGSFLAKLYGALFSSLSGVSTVAVIVIFGMVCCNTGHHPTTTPKQESFSSSASPCHVTSTKLSDSLNHPFLQAQTDPSRKRSKSTNTTSDNDHQCRYLNQPSKKSVPKNNLIEASAFCFDETWTDTETDHDYYKNDIQSSSSTSSSSSADKVKREGATSSSTRVRHKKKKSTAGRSSTVEAPVYGGLVHEMGASTMEEKRKAPQFLSLFSMAFHGSQSKKNDISKCVPSAANISDSVVSPCDTYSSSDLAKGSIFSRSFPKREKNFSDVWRRNAHTHRRNSWTSVKCDQRVNSLIPNVSDRGYSSTRKRQSYLDTEGENQVRSGQTSSFIPISKSVTEPAYDAKTTEEAMTAGTSKKRIPTTERLTEKEKKKSAKKRSLRSVPIVTIAAQFEPHTDKKNDINPKQAQCKPDNAASTKKVRIQTEKNESWPDHDQKTQTRGKKESRVKARPGNSTFPFIVVSRAASRVDHRDLRRSYNKESRGIIPYPRTICYFMLLVSTMMMSYITVILLFLADVFDVHNHLRMEQFFVYQRIMEVLFFTHDVANPFVWCLLNFSFRNEIKDMLGFLPR